LKDSLNLYLKPSKAFKLYFNINIIIIIIIIIIFILLLE